MNNQLIWLLVIVALLVGAFGGYYYEKSKLTNQMMMVESSLQQQLNDAKMKTDQLMKMQTTLVPSGMMHVTTTPKSVMMQK